MSCGQDLMALEVALLKEMGRRYGLNLGRQKKLQADRVSSAGCRGTTQGGQQRGKRF